MVFRHFVEVPFTRRELLFSLFLQNLRVKFEETDNLRHVFYLERVHALIELVEGLEQPLVHFGPHGGEIVLDKESYC